MKRLLTLSLLLLFSVDVFAEQKVCKVNADYSDETRESIQKCEAGDILYWRGSSRWVGRDIVAHYCDQEKQITTEEQAMVGVCTFTGKKLTERETD